MVLRNRLARLVLLLAVAIFSASAQDTYALSGTVAAPGGVIENGMVVIANGTILSVGSRAELPPGTREIKTDGVIFPGLIDLHNHLVWNVFPRWKLAPHVGDRYEWQAKPEYAARLSGPEGKLIAQGAGCDMQRYAEVKALLGGASSVTGSFSPIDSDPHRNDCDRGLARNLDFASDLYGREINREPLRYEVFPFEIPWSQAQAIRDGLTAGKIKALLIHVAEGKDASARREFRMLQARGFLRSGVSVIHGVSLGAAEFAEMASHGMGFVWSPRSNFELYGKTGDLRAAKKANLTIALAPDWSPTGSSGMLAELRFAYQWNRQQKPPVFEDSELVRMVTSNPAALAGAADKIGSLSAGMAADLIVLPRRPGAPLLALLNAKPASVKLVVVGGKPFIGRPELMQQLLPQAKLEFVTVCGHRKALNILDDTGGESWTDIKARLTAALRAFQIPLAPLAECL